MKMSEEEFEKEVRRVNENMIGVIAAEQNKCTNPAVLTAAVAKLFVAHMAAYPVFLGKKTKQECMDAINSTMKDVRKDIEETLDEFLQSPP